MKRIRARLTFANVVACLALFVALGGASYAAIKLPKNSVGAKQLRKGAVTPAKIAKATRAQLVGARGPAGQTGPQGPAGAPGPAGPPAGTLPAGVTLRGSFAIDHEIGTPTALAVTGGVDFAGYALSERPVINLVLPPVLKVPAPPACPGSAEDPQALAGNLCVYVAAEEPSSDGAITISDPAKTAFTAVEYSLPSGSAKLFGDGRASRFGFAFKRGDLVAAEAGMRGTWAVATH
jgi:hypothetical protein